MRMWSGGTMWHQTPKCADPVHPMPQNWQPHETVQLSVEDVIGDHFTFKTLPWIGWQNRTLKGAFRAFWTCKQPETLGRETRNKQRTNKEQTKVEKWKQGLQNSPNVRRFFMTLAVMEPIKPRRVEYVSTHAVTSDDEWLVWRIIADRWSELHQSATAIAWECEEMTGFSYFTTDLKENITRFASICPSRTR